MDKRNVSRYTKTLVDKKFIRRNGVTNQGWIKWQIVIETVINALQLSHPTSHQSDDGQITSHQSDDTTVINLMTPRHQSDDTNLQRNLQRNLQNYINTSDKSAVRHSDSSKKNKVKNPPRPNSLVLAKKWYESTCPTENHDKDKTILEWAYQFDTEQNVTKYTDAQMTQMVTFRNLNEFWRTKGAIRPGGLSKKGKDGVRKTVKIYEQSCSQPGQHKYRPARFLQPGELPF